MGNLGLPELAVILIVAFFVVGPKRLPEIGRALGEAIRAFQDALKSAPPDDKEPDDRQRTLPPPSA